jgi:hypothetical protein
VQTIFLFAFFLPHKQPDSHSGFDAHADDLHKSFLLCSLKYIEIKELYVVYFDELFFFLLPSYFFHSLGLFA